MIDTMQNELAKVGAEFVSVHENWQHQIEECELLKEQLSVTQDQNQQLTQAVCTVVLIITIIDHIIFSDDRVTGETRRHVNFVQRSER